ncbi:SpoIIE family protein phosphatase [Actinoplanes sp. NPDC049265]|uniref:SpoIIE family protein phosphatase n=1 Tax=Actinoplanes sp. NPDC049265 TaxID=3363902 RepID=UPI00371167AE
MVSELPDAQMLAMLDADPQGWVLARAVREGGTIADFVLCYINYAGCQILGRDRGELVGRRYRELWPETVHDGTLPLYRSVVETGRPATRTVFYDRSTVSGHFELNVGPYGDGFLVRFIDLRQVTVSPRSDGGSRLYDLIDAAFDGFTVLRPVHDADGEITDFVCEYVNQLGAKLTGRAVEDVIGHRLSEISPEAWPDGLFERYRTVVRSGEPWRQELSYPSISQVWEIKIGRDGAGFVAISFREITEQVRRERQLADSVARAGALESVTNALVAASTTTDVYAAIGAVLRPSAGGESLALLLRDDEHLRLSFHAGYEPDVAARLAELPIGHPYPATAVARTGRPRFLSSPTHFHQAQSACTDPVPPGDRQAWAFLPLAVAGDVLGALVVGYHRPRDFDADTTTTLMALAGLSAQALQRALLYETSSSIATELQHALLPARLPDTPGLRHAARYLPWTRGTEVGGDWYDIITIRDGVVGVVVGDVAGHNTAAAAAMGQVRDALRAYALDGHRPSAVMERTGRLIRDIGLDTFATCCYLELEVTTGAVTGVLAGHPPPLLRHGGQTSFLALPPGAPLGTQRVPAYRDTSFVLPSGATLLLYTDGLVEDHQHPLDLGLDELRRALRAAPSTDPTKIIDHILAGDVGPRPRRDDVAMLCLTRAQPDP